MKYWGAIIFLLISFTTISQNKDCGYKNECICDTTDESLLNSYNISAIVINCEVIKIDTISIKEIITPTSVLKIKNDTLSKSECAKHVLPKEKVIRIKVKVLEIFKGEIIANEVYILTPFSEKYCGYNNFVKNEEFIIFGTLNETADFYFLWTFDSDYFYLKTEYSIWTNKCKRTALTKKSEILELRRIKRNL